MYNILARGRCYKTSFTLLDLFNRHDFQLCHGIGVRTVPPHERMGHAWIELDDGRVIDPLYPATPIARDEYYRIGQIDAASVVRYSLIRARRNVKRSGHEGPWAEHVAAAAHAGDGDD